MTRVTIVDDSPVDRMLIAGLLRDDSNYEFEFAENGAEALERLAGALADVVISDLIMPEMDGVELVREMRRQNLQIPVILMTAYGNESIAAEALAAGAASYVPKAQQAQRLRDAVARILARAACERSRCALADCVDEYHCAFSLPNDPALIEPLLDEIQQRLMGVGVGDSVERIRAMVALEESIDNAICHGNLQFSRQELADAREQNAPEALAARIRQRGRLPRYRKRKVHIMAHVSCIEGAQFTVRDDGAGFDVTAVAIAQGGDCFENGRTRGLTLMRALMDEVTYNDSGVEVVLVKHASSAGAR